MVLTDLKGFWDVNASQRAGMEQIWVLSMVEPAVTTGYVFNAGPDSLDPGIDMEGNTSDIMHVFNACMQDLLDLSMNPDICSSINAMGYE